MTTKIVTSLSDLPNIFKQPLIGIDTETYDPDLLDDGPGWGRHRGYLVGISLATLDGRSWYLPVKHVASPEYDLPRTELTEYMTELLHRVPIKIGANCMYDLGWLMEEGITSSGIWYDVQFAEALIDGHARSYSLETVAQKHLKEGKQGNELYEWAASRFRGQPTAKDQGGNIYRCPADIVGKYAGVDAILPIKILQEQQHILTAYDLEELFEVECKLIPILVKMRMRGMPIDPLKAQEAITDLKLSEDIMRQQLYDFAGFHVNVGSSKELAKLYDKVKLPYPRTDKGNPSFTSDWLKQQHDPIATKINQIRKVKKAYSEFIQQGILDRLLDSNTVHPSLHPLRGENGGAGTGRFSSSKPNGQNIPARDDLLAPIIRGLFIPEKGYTAWLKMDFSQIEYRFFAHYSNDKILCAEYAKEGTDFHELVGKFLGDVFPRRLVKNINFAKLYGAGHSKLKAMLLAGGGAENIDVDEFIQTYNKKFPQAEQLMKSCANEASSRGEIRTILNRKLTFPNWIPKGTYGKTPLPYYQAIKSYGTYIERADTYKAINYRFQGSAADYIKKGLVLAEEAGIFDRTGYPHITVHDELDFSYHNDLREDFIELRDCMEHAIELRVPMVMDTEIGPNWGDLTDLHLES